MDKSDNLKLSSSIEKNNEDKNSFNFYGSEIENELFKSDNKKNYFVSVSKNKRYVKQHEEPRFVVLPLSVYQDRAYLVLAEIDSQMGYTKSTVVNVHIERDRSVYEKMLRLKEMGKNNIDLQSDVYAISGLVVDKNFSIINDKRVSVFDRADTILEAVYAFNYYNLHDRDKDAEVDNAIEIKSVWKNIYWLVHHEVIKELKDANAMPNVINRAGAELNADIQEMDIRDFLSKWENKLQLIKSRVAYIGEDALSKRKIANVQNQNILEVKPQKSGAAMNAENELR